MAKIDMAQIALTAQAKAVRRAASMLGDAEAQALVAAAADTVDAVARRQEHRKTLEAATPVLELSANATPSEVRVARQRRAVRRGKDVFLPSWKDATVALPNALEKNSRFSGLPPAPRTIIESQFS